MRLLHFSDDPKIVRFVPRPVRTPARRPPGREWLNGPLVWAIDEAHLALYLFPRDCPRILIWPTAMTTREDREFWFAGSAARMIAFVERSRLDELAEASIFRYELPHAEFVDLEDAGMWVSRAAVSPLRVDELTDLPGELRAADVELRLVDSFADIGGVFDCSLHASGIRLRNARAATRF
ncbi:MAG TPA: hypothetical protein VIF40_14910 [Methylosinus sp.]|jgi:hypothetical protein|uniref:DUF6886 family protein n=1 Tax=Methylosinus sp. TaxID=427 RepID=UPI002F9304CA